MPSRSEASARLGSESLETAYMMDRGYNCARSSRSTDTPSRRRTHGLHEPKDRRDLRGRGGADVRGDRPRRPGPGACHETTSVNIFHRRARPGHGRDRRGRSVALVFGGFNRALGRGRRRRRGHTVAGESGLWAGRTRRDAGRWPGTGRVEGAHRDR